MQLKRYSFEKLPFSKLFKTYVGDFSKVADFYATNPFDAGAVTAAADAFEFTGSRDQSVKLLKDFNQPFDPDEAALQNIERFGQDDALALVTGQQLGLYGGPLYTIYKTLTTIHLARQWEQKLGRPVIPVFWLADEDHDFQEVQSIRILAEEEVRSFALPNEDRNLPPVSELDYPDELKEIASQLRAALIDTDFSDDLWTMLDSFFNPGDAFIKGFGRFITLLFSKHGVVLAGSDYPAIKAHLKETMIQTVEKADELREALEETSEEIAEVFHQQASVYDSHLFYLHPKKGRIKIQRNGDGWQAGEAQWSKKELVQEIKSSPEVFSPDVFLRPILQDRLLPTLGYVGGPGEIAYYGQMKSFYRCFDQTMPVIFPRMSATLIEPAIDRILDELPFNLREYENRIEDLESTFVERTGQTDIEAIFKKWVRESEQVADVYKEEIASIDETLAGAVEKVKAHYENELNQLKGKVYRAVKKNEEIQIKRIHRIQQNLFPDRSLQERVLCGIYYMNKFGLDIWDQLLQEMQNGVSFDSHTLIYL